MIGTSLIRVLVVDDHSMVREGIRHVLTPEEGFDLIGEAANGDEATRLALDTAPDVVVLDITLPDISGLEVTTQIRRQRPSIKILILSMHDHAQYVVEAVRAGAEGYLLKDTGPQELRRAVRALHAGGSYFGTRAATHLRDAVVTNRTPTTPTVDMLTPREIEVLTLVADGHTSRTIATELGISPRTVETHRESVMRKLEIRSIAGLTRFALENKLTQR